jgi:1,4-dihydroxy-2-naphthoate octaprenyltransferase
VSPTNPSTGADSATGAAIFRALFRAARPVALLGGLLLYALGAGIASFLGERIDGSAYALGQGALLMALLAAAYLREYFDRASQPPFEQVARLRRRPAEPPSPGAGPTAGADGTGADGSAVPETVEVIVPRLPFLQAAFAALTAGAALTALLAAQGRLSPGAALFLALAYLLGLAWASPPLRLVYSGYGELVMAILLANLFPAVAYLLQAGDLHRLLALLTFPLTLLLLAAALARALQGYMEDIRQGRRTMMVRAGWQRGMVLHNALVAGAYLALAAAVINGLEGRLAYPAFLSLPAALYQIWQINHIAAGGKPRWRLLGFTALATPALMMYFINLALWTN